MQQLKLAGGGQTTLLETDGDHVALICSEPYPPGCTLVARVVGENLTLQIKVRGCRRLEATEPRRFRLEGRFVNLGKAERERLLSSRK
jgi:hypothetical protein